MADDDEDDAPAGDDEGDGPVLDDEDAVEQGSAG
jgi:hypothetical protein